MKQRESPGKQPAPQASTKASRPRDTLPWRAMEQQVVRMQKQILHASGRGDKETVYRLQQRLLESEAARLLAVRRVAEENQGKDTAGVDGVKSLSAQVGGIVWIEAELQALASIPVTTTMAGLQDNARPRCIPGDGAKSEETLT